MHQNQKVESIVQRKIMLCDLFWNTKSRIRTKVLVRTLVVNTYKIEHEEKTMMQIKCELNNRRKKEEWREKRKMIFIHEKLDANQRPSMTKVSLCVCMLNDTNK